MRVQCIDESGDSLEAELPDAVPGEAGVESYGHLPTQRSMISENRAILELRCATEHDGKLVLHQEGIRMTHRAAAVCGADDLRVAELEAIAAIGPHRC